MASLPPPERSTDPTWIRAKKIVRGCFPVPSQVWQLVRSSWSGLAVDQNLIAHLSGSSVGAGFIFDAAQPTVLGTRDNIVTAAQAIESLGHRSCATVVAINYTVRTVLRLRPTIAWEKILREMAASAEVGAIIGRRIPSLGVEGGVLVGAARSAALCFLLVNFPKEFKKWWISSGAKPNRKVELDLFGCEAYQISAFILQQLGFGTAVALGVSVGMSSEDVKDHVKYPKNVLRWKAGYHWVEALRFNRSYPADRISREFYQELKVQPGGKSSTLLEVLYSEVANVARNGSKWTWHLPRASYEDTAGLLTERKSKVAASE
jgi:hypothetical protein